MPREIVYMEGFDDLPLTNPDMLESNVAAWGELLQRGSLVSDSGLPAVLGIEAAPSGGHRLRVASVFSNLSENNEEGRKLIPTSFVAENYPGKSIIVSVNMQAITFHPCAARFRGRNLTLNLCPLFSFRTSDPGLSAAILTFYANQSGGLVLGLDPLNRVPFSPSVAIEIQSAANAVFGSHISWERSRRFTFFCRRYPLEPDLTELTIFEGSTTGPLLSIPNIDDFSLPNISFFAQSGIYPYNYARQLQGLPSSGNAQVGDVMFHRVFDDLLVHVIEETALPQNIPYVKAAALPISDVSLNSAIPIGPGSDEHRLESFDGDFSAMGFVGTESFTVSFAAPVLGDREIEGIEIRTQSAAPNGPYNVQVASKMTTETLEEARTIVMTSPTYIVDRQVFLDTAENAAFDETNIDDFRLIVRGAPL